MSVFGDIARRSKTGDIRKEDCLPISVKITKKTPYYDWTIYYVQFKNDNNRHWVRWNICFPDSNMKVENILPILTEHGLDTKNIDEQRWKDLTKGTGHYQEFVKWKTEQFELAEQEGLMKKDNYMDYSFTIKKLRNPSYLVTVTMRMYGEWRKFKYVFDYDKDNWEYEDYKTGKTRYTTISEAIACDVEGMINILPHLNLTKEEWDDNGYFKDMYAAARNSIKRYNSCYW